MPASESSRTKVSEVFTPNFSHDFKNTSGLGFPLETSSPHIESSKYGFNPANSRI